MLLPRCRTTVLCLAGLTSALPDANLQGRAAVPCSDPTVKSLISIINAVASADASTFCSSYLHYTRPTTTTTKTITSTSTVTSSVTKGTTTITVTVTQIKPKRSAAREKAVVKARATAPALAADSAGKVSGFPSDIVSGACSCLVSKPTGTATVTKTTTKLVTTTKTISVLQTKSKTVTVTPTSKPTKSTATRKNTSASSAVPTTSSSPAPSPVCTGPDPTFRIQLIGTNPARVDQYEGQYIGQAPDTYRGLGTGDVLTAVPLLTSASIFALECATGRAKTPSDGKYVDADPYLCLTPMYIDPEAWVDTAGFYFWQCRIEAGLLKCTVPYPCVRTVMETCPEYDSPRIYSTPIAWGDIEYVDGPVCYAKNMVVVPV